MGRRRGRRLLRVRLHAGELTRPVRHGARASIGLLFVFWSVPVSSKGVRATFDVGVWKARVRFLVLPLAVSIVAFGALAVVTAFFQAP